MMAEKNNKISLYRVFIILMILGGFLSLLFSVDARMDKAIADHPEIVTLKVNQAQMKRNQECIQKELKEINKTLNDIDKKLSRLLAENYP